MTGINNFQAVCYCLFIRKSDQRFSNGLPKGTYDIIVNNCKFVNTFGAVAYCSISGHSFRWTKSYRFLNYQLGRWKKFIPWYCVSCRWLSRDRSCRHFHYYPRKIRTLVSFPFLLFNIASLKAFIIRNSM